MKSSEIPRDDAWPAEVPLEIQYPDFCWTSKKPRNLEHVQLKQAEVFTAKSSIDFCREACFRCFYIKSYRVVIAMDHGELPKHHRFPKVSAETFRSFTFSDPKSTPGKKQHIFFFNYKFLGPK